MKKICAVLFCVLCIRAFALPPSFSGIYPSLAFFNNEGECGTGAVVPWADRLWVITYGPHKPEGSSDKLYEIDSALVETIRPESVGGTPANRMIHRESNQLFIGPYAIDATGGVRVITPKQMYGRLTGNARHLTDPENKICYATMEEGIYEVDVRSLAVKELWADEQRKTGMHADLPGYHGKGFYSGQGVMIYANNGDHDPKALSDPTVPSGVLAEWDGKADPWTVVRRNQFTDITGPGGISGAANPATDPIWAIGWDYRSLILGVREPVAGGGDPGRPASSPPVTAWHFFRLPKASHAYDGAHGWNTEWPRIREIGEKDFLMTMHGMFWRFPKTFSSANANGIRPRSAYLKVIGDFCRWNDRLVFGCDDTAKSEFLNKGKLKGALAGPGQSQSNLWFTDPETPDRLGPANAEGAVWLHDAIKAGDVSDPFLFAGWENRGAHFVNGGNRPMTFALEVDAKGDGAWTKLRDVKVGANESLWTEFSANESGEWIRVKSANDCSAATVHFAFAQNDRRTAKSDAIFDGLAKIGDANYGAGLVRARGENKRSLAVVATAVEKGVVTEAGYYELDGDMKLRKVDDPASLDFTKKSVAIPRDVLQIDSASVLITDSHKRRWRLPKNPAFDAATSAGLTRIDREVSTERDLLNCYGTFYEVPAENADGFAKIRPVASHNLAIMDYCSYRGMLILTGIGVAGGGDAGLSRKEPGSPPPATAANAGEKNPHIIRSDDGRAAVWAGAIDDLWKLGKPVGRGGPWKNSAVKAGVPSDPYLFGFYDKRTIALTHASKESVTFTIEIDPGGQGTWVTYKAVVVKPDFIEQMEFPAALSARWIRVTASRDCTATAQLDYE